MTLTNENSKQKVILEGKEEELTELSSRFETMKNRWETEMGARIGLEEKCARNHQ